MKTTTAPQKAFITMLKELYSIEKQQLKLIPRLERAATTRYLKASYKGHLAATHEHVIKLERVFALLNQKVGGKKNRSMDEMVVKSISVIKTTEKKTMLRDLGLIMKSITIEEFEVGKYEQLIMSAGQFNNPDLILLLEEILNEEREAKETFEAVKEDTLRDELFITKTEVAEEFEAAE